MDLIAKKYRVLKSLGQGAMGEVYLVLPPRGDPVALKLLRTSESADQKMALEQFENEFKVLKRLSHPNIGSIYDYGYDDELKKVYFTSPWLKGTDLFKATKNMDFEEAEDLFVQILRAINYLHQKGIVHCDLKPGNIFVENGQIVLIDFGLADYWGDSIVGTPTYLAPEIFKGERHSEESDLYALGVIFYNCLTRSQPFSGKSLQEVYDRHRTFTPPPISKLNEKVPKYFSDIASMLLAKKAEERYSSAKAVIEEIATFSSRQYSVETPETLMSYLPTTSDLIGRKEIQWSMQKVFDQFLKKDKSVPYNVMHLYGESGVGKTQFIEQIKNKLQLEKMPVESVILPLSENDHSVLNNAKAIILEDVESYLDPEFLISQVESSPNQEAPLQDFLSYLEQKILSPETNQFLFILTSESKEIWKKFEALFPQEELFIEQIQLTPFDRHETRLFLESIIGQEQTPESFVAEVFSNTGGNPAFCKQLIEGMISEGYLFDGDGRWSSDLLTHLEEALKSIETPKSLQEKLHLEYNSLNDLEKEILNWLALSPHGLSEQMFLNLIDDERLRKTLTNLLEKKYLRIEKDHRYYFYRSAMIPIAVQSLSKEEQRSHHTRLAMRDLGLDLYDVWMHQSYGSDRMVAQDALEHLGEAMSLSGEKEKALDCYQRLNQNYRTAPLQQRLDWSIKASEILIWLDRFGEAELLLSSIESEIGLNRDSLSYRSRLLLYEKKGLALLHQKKIDQARAYFNKGYEKAKGNEETKAEEIRFLNDLAQIQLITGHSKEAIEQFSEARNIAKSLSKDQIKRITNNDLAYVHYQMRQYRTAIALLEQDIKIFETLSNKEPLARSLYTLAECYRAIQDYEEALQVYKHSVQISKEEKLLPLLLRAYNGMGNIYLSKGEFADALDDYQRAIDISVRLKDSTTKAALLANQALIYCRQENWTQASRRFLLAKQILEQKEDKLAYENQLLSKCYNELKLIAQEENDSMKALSYQIEKSRLTEKYEATDTERFSVKHDLAELYLENRLADPFKLEIDDLESLAQTPEDIEKVSQLKEKWKSIDSHDHEQTMKVE